MLVNTTYFNNIWEGTQQTLPNTVDLSRFFQISPWRSIPENTTTLGYIGGVYVCVIFSTFKVWRHSILIGNR